MPFPGGGRHYWEPWGLCDRCGFAYPQSRLHRDPVKKGRWVCSGPGTVDCRDQLGVDELVAARGERPVEKPPEELRGGRFSAEDSGQSKQ